MTAIFTFNSLDLCHESSQVNSLRLCRRLISFSARTAHEPEIVFHHLNSEHLLLNSSDVLVDRINEVHAVYVSPHHVLEIVVQLHAASALLRERRIIASDCHSADAVRLV